MEALFGAVLVGMLAEMRIAMSKLGKRVDRIELQHERDRTGKHLIHGTIPLLLSAIAYTVLH